MKFVSYAQFTFQLIIINLLSFINHLTASTPCDQMDVSEVLWDSSLVRRIKWNEKLICNDSCDFTNLRHRGLQGQNIILPYTQKLDIVIDPSDRVDLLMVTTENGFAVCQPEFTEDMSATLTDIPIGNSTVYRLSTPMPGSVYIIARTLNHGLVACQQGQKLNVTFVHHFCSPADNSVLCGGRKNGVCALNKFRNRFECFCCNNANAYCDPRMDIEMATQEICMKRTKCIANVTQCFSGKCVDVTNDVKCSCFLGSSGTCCESKADPCSVNPCLNGGICHIVDNNNMKCLCGSKHTGLLCERHIGVRKASCLSNQCMSDSFCLESESEVTCVSKSIKATLQRCDAELCFNQGECIIVNNKPHCFCPGNYVGEYCQDHLVGRHRHSNVMLPALITIASAFGIVVAILVLCHCHTYSCSIYTPVSQQPYRRQSEERSQINRIQPNYSLTESPLITGGRDESQLLNVEAITAIGCVQQESLRLVTDRI